MKGGCLLRAGIVLGLLLLVFVVFYIGFARVAQKARDQVMGEMAASERVEFYEALVKETPGAVSEDTPPELAKELREAKDSIAQYDSMADGLANLKSDYAWQDFQKGAGSEAIDQWQEADFVHLASLLAEHEALLAKVHVLAEMGGPVCALDFSQFPPEDTSHLSELRAFARLLRAEAIVLARSGEDAKAVEAVATCLKLGNGLAKEPLLLSQLVRIAIVGLACQSYCDAFAAGDLPADRTQALIELAGRSMQHEAYGEAVGSEGYYGARSMEQQMAGAGFLGYVARPITNWTVQGYSRGIGHVAEAMKLPYHEAKPRLERIEADIDNMSFISYIPRTLLQLTAPAFSGGFAGQARAVAQLGLLQLGIALEQYHGEHGIYPENLRAVEGAVGGTLPVDPFTGKAFRYEAAGETFVLYSLGNNQVDDGGRHSLRNADIVWRGRKDPSEKRGR